MKKLSICILLSLVAPGIAQTNLIIHKTILVTNWYWSETFRQVNGQIYDPRFSAKWKTGLNNDAPQTTQLGYFMGDVEAVRITKSNVLCAVYLADNSGGKNFQNYVMIYNYPHPKELLTGQRIGNYPCMKVENYQSGGDSCVAFDCGVPVTNAIPIVKEVKIQLTNSEAIKSPK